MRRFGIENGPDARDAFPPEARAAAVHLACQKPGTVVGLPACDEESTALPIAVEGADQSVTKAIVVPVSRFSAGMIAWLLVRLGVVAAISSRTIQRWLKADKLKPWRFRSWITPKDLAAFLARACDILDLYERVRAGELTEKEIVYSVDEKTSIQARERPSYKPSGAGEPAHVEHTYRRRGAVRLTAALNVAIGTIFGVVTDGKGTFQLFADFLTTLIGSAIDQGYERVHLILDNASTHRPKYLRTWLAQSFPDVDVELHWLPVRSSWLNQIEIFFSLLQTQALTPNDFVDTDAVRDRILGYIDLRNEEPRPIDWTYTSAQLRVKHHNVTHEPRVGRRDVA